MEGQTTILGIDKSIAINFLIVAAIIIGGTIAINQFVKTEKKEKQNG